MVATTNYKSSARHSLNVQQCLSKPPTKKKGTYYFLLFGILACAESERKEGIFHNPAYR